MVNKDEYKMNTTIFLRRSSSAVIRRQIEVES